VILYLLDAGTFVLVLVEQAAQKVDAFFGQLAELEQVLAQIALLDELIKVEVFGGVRVDEQRVPEQHSHHECPHREHVCFLRVLVLLLCDLGRVLALRAERGGSGCLAPLGQEAEVAQLGRAARAHQDVLGLDVQVRQLARAQVAQPVQEVREDALGGLLGEGAGELQLVEQVAVLAVLLQDVGPEGHALGRAELALQVVRQRDGQVGVVELRRAALGLECAQFFLFELVSRLFEHLCCESVTFGTFN